MMMAGSLHPPFSLFLPEEKEKTGRARSKREKEVSPLRGDVGRGTRKGCFLRVRMSSARGVVRAGVVTRRMDKLLFPLALPGPLKAVLN